jgi:NAD+ synthase (glutamine-hydrolysing)
VSIENKYHKIVDGIAKYFHIAGFHKAYIGLSGGIDSALTAKLAVDALGSNNVVGFLLPYSPITSNESISLGATMGVFLDIKTKIIEVDNVVDSLIEAADLTNDIAIQNAQARARGMILMGLSNENGGMVLCTGNKTEALLGYCTLYGDTCGGLAPIGGLYKTDVFQMAKFLKLPEQIIKRAPSAELKGGQTDEECLGYTYEHIDKMLQEETWNEDIYQMMEKSKFKLKQLPEVIKLA